MNIISLFAGAGGLDLGFTEAGFNIIWANEFDKTIWKTYELNHKNSFLNRKNIKDIKNEELPENVDGVIGGPPCQSWSLAGSMRGINDKRGALFYEYIRLLKSTKAKFFVIENVKGMLSKTHIDEFNNFLKIFEELGYICSYKLLNAFDYETPQTRERVFIVGFRKDLNIKYSFPKSSLKKIYLKDVLEGLENAVEFNENKNLTVPNNEYFTGSFSSMFMSRNRIRNYSEASFTIQASARHAPIHPSSPKMVKIEKDKFKFDGDIAKVRRLSVRECARIQGFPDDFIFLYENINNGYKMIGNAVPVRLSYFIAKEISKYLK